jgi:hypothetical protein
LIVCPSGGNYSSLEGEEVVFAVEVLEEVADSGFAVVEPFA